VGVGKGRGGYRGAGRRGEGTAWDFVAGYGFLAKFGDYRAL